MSNPLPFVDESNDPEVRLVLMAAMRNGPAPSIEMKERVSAAVLTHFQAQRSGVRMVDHGAKEQVKPIRSDKPNTSSSPRKRRSSAKRVFVALVMAAISAAVALFARFKGFDAPKLAAPETVESSNVAFPAMEVEPESKQNLLRALEPNAGPETLAPLTPVQRQMVEEIRNFRRALEPDAGPETLEALTPVQREQVLELRARVANGGMSGRITETPTEGKAGRIMPEKRIAPIPQSSASVAPHNAKMKTAPKHFPGIMELGY